MFALLENTGVPRGQETDWEVALHDLHVLLCNLTLNKATFSLMLHNDNNHLYFIIRNDVALIIIT